MKNFKKADFIRSHPGGALGQRLSCRVEELMLHREKAPCIQAGTSMARAIECMDAFRLGAVLVMDKENQLAGILTDGDIRHWVAKGKAEFKEGTVDDFMTASPLFLNPRTYLYDALNLMEKHEITVLPIIGEDRQVVGLLHLHDILGKGTFKFNGGSQ